MSQDIFARIIELDRRAQQVLERAQQQVQSTHQETVRQVEEARAEVRRRAAEAAAEIQSSEEKSRGERISHLAEEFASQARAVRSADAGTVANAVAGVVERARGPSR